MARITIEVDRDGRTGHIQLSLNVVEDGGVNHGYRLAGPKFNGSSLPLLVHELTERDKARLRLYLDPEDGDR